MEFQIGDKVRIKVGRSKERTGFVSAISKKGTMGLRNYGKWSEVIRIIKSNDTNGDIRERDSKEKKRSKRTESSIKDYHCPLLTDDTIKKSHRRSDCSRINTLSKKDQSKPLTVCMDINTISQG